jgi:hypothetical protein
MVNLIPTGIVSSKKTISGSFFSILKNNVYTCIKGGGRRRRRRNRAVVEPIYIYTLYENKRGR